MRKVIFTCLFPMLLSLPLNGQDSGLQLLSNMRKQMGLTQSLSNFQVYALADCKGPSSTFTTLVISDANNSRFEQKSGARHTVGLINSNEANWYNVHTAEASPADSASITFLVDHELHMIAYFPESRFGAPLSKKDTLFHDQPAWQLNFKDIKGGVVRVYYAKKDLQPIGYTVYNHLGRGPLWIDTLFEKWHQKGAIRTFSAARFLQGSEVYEYEFTELRFGNLPKGLFERTDAIIK